MSKRSLEASVSQAKRQRALPAAAQLPDTGEAGNSNRNSSSAEASRKILQQRRQFIARVNNSSKTACAGMRRSGSGSTACPAPAASTAAQSSRAAETIEHPIQQPAAAAISRNVVNRRIASNSRELTAAARPAVCQAKLQQSQHAGRHATAQKPRVSTNSNDGYGLLGPCRLLSSLAQKTSDKDSSSSNSSSSNKSQTGSTPTLSVEQSSQSRAVKQPPVAFGRSVSGSAAVTKQQPVQQQQQPRWQLSASANSKLSSTDGISSHQTTVRSNNVPTRTAAVSKLVAAGQQQGFDTAGNTTTKHSSSKPTTTSSTASAEDGDAAAMVFKRRPSKQSTVPVSVVNSRQKQHSSCDNRHTAAVGTSLLRSKQGSSAAVTCRVNAGIRQQQHTKHSSNEQQGTNLKGAKAAAALVTESNAVTTAAPTAKAAAAINAAPAVPHTNRRKVHAKRSAGLSRAVDTAAAASQITTSAECDVPDDLDLDLTDLSAGDLDHDHDDVSDDDHDPIAAKLASFGCTGTSAASQAVAAGTAAAAGSATYKVQLLTRHLMDTLAAIEQQQQQQSDKQMSSEQQASWQQWQQAAEEHSVLPVVPHLQQTAADAVAAFARSCTGAYLIDGAASDVLWAASPQATPAPPATAAVIGCDTAHNQTGRRVLRAKRSLQGDNRSTTATTAAAGLHGQAEFTATGFCQPAAAASPVLPSTVELDQGPDSSSDRSHSRKWYNNLNMVPTPSSDGSSSTQIIKRIRIKGIGCVSTSSQLQRGTGGLAGSSSSAGGQGCLTGKAAAYAAMLAAERGSGA